VHTVELLPDSALDQGVRNLWLLLRDAGLKSLADHPQATNRPHLTVVSAASLAGLKPFALPVAVELGAVVFLGRALVREVTPTDELAALHAHVWASLSGVDRWPSPAEWRPHISLALNVPPAQHAAARRLLDALPPARGQLVAARSYDTQARKITDW
jgi:2'-5' RNA ligase superfamily protein